MRLAVSGLLLLLLALPSSLAAESVEAIVAQAHADCASFDDGTLTAEDAVIEVDLDGAAPMDHLVDTSRLDCSTMPGLYCGSGGCTLFAVIGERSWDFQAEGWRMIDWDGRPILLIARDGGWCGGAGAQLCYEAVTWSAGEMLTVMPAP